MTAATCGACSNPRKVAPPLKSTSTRFRISGECANHHAQRHRSQELSIFRNRWHRCTARAGRRRFSGFLDVQFDRCTAGRGADRNPKPVAVMAFRHNAAGSNCSARRSLPCLATEPPSPRLSPVVGRQPAGGHTRVRSPSSSGLDSRRHPQRRCCRRRRARSTSLRICIRPPSVPVPPRPI